PDGKIVLLRHYRYTVDDWCWEIPAGGVKPGQTVEEAAREELREEIGGQAQTLERLGQFYTANGICNEVGYYFLATGVSLGIAAHEPAELMEIHPTPAAEVLRMARTGQITDASSALVILLCEAYLEKMLLEY
ncbi:MAG TPA: NUDIX hydrolase, partial [Anaerolineae bacterium]|nr:NUDIX hydrolase [Anaerolineae bacterium]